MQHNGCEKLINGGLRVLRGGGGQERTNARVGRMDGCSWSPRGSYIHPRANKQA
jgi:hypothetical protein